MGPDHTPVGIQHADEVDQPKRHEICSRKFAATSVIRLSAPLGGRVRVETERLIIRSFSRSDIPAYAAIAADPRVTRFLADGSAHSPADAEAYILDCIDRDQATGISRYAVLLKHDESLIGFCGFRELPDYIDFGWRYAQRAWGHGFATEAALRVLEYGLEELKLTNLAAGSYTDNIASVKIIQKLGFRHVQGDQFYGKATVRYYQWAVA